MGVVSDTCCENERDFREVWVPISMNQWLEGTIYTRKSGRQLMEKYFSIKEKNNRHDPFAVVVIKDNTIVGHVSRKLSAICSLFLRSRGSIVCKVRGSKWYSYDLPQGGLKIPCTRIYSGEQSKILKIKGIINDIMLAEESKKKDESGESRSEDEVDDLNCESVVKRRQTSNDMIWVCIAGTIS